MRKYIIVRKWAWTSFWDISFGNRIRFWEFAQTINKINNYKYTLLVQSENVDVWGESYFINYPNTIVVRSFPTIGNKKVRLIDNAKNYHEGTFVFDDDVIDITPSVDNWNYVRPLWDENNSKVSTKTDNVVAQEYQKTGHRPIFDIEIYDKKLETIIKEEVKGRVGLHLRGDTPNGQWDIYKKQHPNSRKEYIKQELDKIVDSGFDKFYLSTDIFVKPTQRLIKKDFVNFHKGVLTDFDETHWSEDLINKDEYIWNDAFYEYDKEEYLWINRLNTPADIMKGIGGEKQYNWVKELYDEYDIIDYRSILSKYDTFLNNWKKLRCIDIIDLWSLIYSEKFSDQMGNNAGTFSRFVTNYRKKFE